MIINKQVRDLKVGDKVLIVRESLTGKGELDYLPLTKVEYLPEIKQMRIEYLYGGEPAIFVLGLKMTVPVIVKEFQI